MPRIWDFLLILAFSSSAWAESSGLFKRVCSDPGWFYIVWSFFAQSVAGEFPQGSSPQSPFGIPRIGVSGFGCPVPCGFPVPWYRVDSFKRECSDAGLFYSVWSVAVLSLSESS